MKAYIKGMGVISPQQTWGNAGFLDTPVNYDTNFLTCIEPDYSQWIDPKYLRRMSRILKIGITSALMALKDASLEKPDAIITGTGYGCLEDTTTFLTKIATLKEEALNPTAFMQSTHNTIGSQIALLLSCDGYNQTFAQGAFSFEQSLLDALLKLKENSSHSILTGAVDEITSASYAIQSRFDKYRHNSAGSLALLQKTMKGTLAGEGAAYFVLSGNHDADSKASIDAVRMMYHQYNENILIDAIKDLSRDNDLRPEDIDMILVGKSGDASSDQNIDRIIHTLFKESTIGAFKHLCGEHCVTTSFALWLGTMILHHDYIPDVVLQKNANRKVRYILIYNSYFQDHHSLILLKSCRDIRK